MPDGISFKDGVFSGTPTEAFDDYVNVTAVNSGGQDMKSYRLIVNGTSNKASPELGQSATIVDDYVIVCELPEISVDVSGMYDFDVVLDEELDTELVLVWIAGSDEPSEDDYIAEFYDDTGAEIISVPESRNITVSAWLNKGRIYQPSVAVR